MKRFYHNVTSTSDIPFHHQTYGRVYSASWVKYNANPSESTAVASANQSISFALKLPYDQVSQELFSDNIDDVAAYLKEHGAVEYDKFTTDTTAVEFADSNKRGVYVLALSSRSGGSVSHFGCVIDNKFYDSIDCRNMFVASAWKCPDRKVIHTQQHWLTSPDVADEHHLIKDMFADGLENNELLEDYNLKITPRYSLVFDKYNNLTAKCAVTVESLDSSIKYKKTWKFNFTYPIGNPEISDEEADKIIREVTSAQGYSTVYSIASEIKTDIETAEAQANSGRRRKVNLTNSDEKSAYAQLPLAIRSRVRELSVDPNEDYYNIYYVVFEPLSGDPSSKLVRLYGHDMDMINEEIQLYKDSFKRPIDDYDLSELSSY